MGGSNYKPINIFIINPMHIKGIYDLFPDYISQNDTYEERLFDEKTFKWNGIFFKNRSLDDIMEMIEDKIKEIKHQEKIQNNIIIANDISQNFSSEKLFKGINKINNQLDIKILVIYISQEKIENVKKFDNRTITNIYGNKINDKEFMVEKLRYILSMKDCFFNQRTLEFKKSLNSYDIVTTNQFLNIAVIGPSRAGKSTLCNTLLNKYEALESSAPESITEVVNEYSNEYLRVYDTPGITESKKLGDTSKIVLKCLKNILKKVDDSMDDIHVIFFVLKKNPNIENMLPILKFLDKENKTRIEDNRKKIPIIFIVNEPKNKKSEEEEDDEFEEINEFKETAKGLKNYLEKYEVENLYSEYDDDTTNDDEDHNIIWVDIRKEKNAVRKIFKKLYFYIRKNNPFSTDLFTNMEEINQNFQRINEIKNNPNINDIKKDRINAVLKKNKEECQKVILKISKENSFFEKIYSLENILKSSEIQSKLAIAICCVTSFGTGFIPIPFLDIPLLYTQQGIMILGIAFSYGFAIDEIPFKAAIGAAFGISVAVGGGATETVAHIGIQKGGKALIEKSITEAGEKFGKKTMELTSLYITQKTSETISIKLIEEGGKQIQETFIKNTIKEGGKKITQQVSEKAVEYGCGIITKKVSENVLKVGGEIITKEVGSKLTSEAGEEIGKMTTSKITKEIATELMKKSGKTTVVGSAAESSKIVPIIGTIIGGSISGSLNLASTIGMGLAVRKFFKHLVCLTAGANYILVKKKNIDKIFEYIENIINNNYIIKKIEYINN